MQLTRFIGPESVLTMVSCESKRHLFQQMVASLVTPDFLSRNQDLSYESVLAEVEAREAQRSTAMGGEIAFPHARIEGLETPALAIAVLKEPLLYDEVNSVRIVCMMLSSLEEPTLSLKVMAQLSRVLMDPAVFHEYATIESPEALLVKLEAESLSIDVPVCARDIMRSRCPSVHPDTPLREVAHLMFSGRLHTIPVVDDEQRVVGDITTSSLFRFGLPDFFTKLKSVSFIAEFDPFEKYFAKEAGSVARDVMETDCGVIPADYTILEVVFDLAVRKVPKLYVQDDKERWIGVIDHSTVLDNVINF